MLTKPNDVCHVHNRPLTGFTTLFCPDCDREAEMVKKMSADAKQLRQAAKSITFANNAFATGKGAPGHTPVAQQIAKRATPNQWDVSGKIIAVHNFSDHTGGIVEHLVRLQVLYGIWTQVDVRVMRYIPSLVLAFGKDLSCTGSLTGIGMWTVGPDDTILIS